MTVLGAQRAHRRFRGGVEILDLFGGVAGGAAVEAHTDERLRFDRTAELHELLEPRPRRLKSAPGAERLALLDVAHRLLPIEITGIDRAAAEADDARLKR